MMSPNISSKMSAKPPAKSKPPARAPGAVGAVLESGMAEAVIGRALLWIAEALIGLVQFLEAGLGLRVAGMAIGMALHRRLAKGDLHLDFGRGAGNPENFVVIALGHGQVVESKVIARKGGAGGDPPCLACRR